MFKTDLTHYRNKVVSSKFYELAKEPVRTSRLNNKTARRLKKDRGSMILQCKHNPMDNFMVGAKAVLQHLYNNNDFCGEWCDAKRPLQRRSLKIIQKAGCCKKTLNKRKCIIRS